MSIISAERTKNNEVRRRILLVDDEPDLTITISIALKSSDFEVDSFNDSVLALSNFRPFYYDLVILDIKMPKMDGFMLYERLKIIEPGVKVCFLTAGEMYREEFREMNHCAVNKNLFLQKPISNDDLTREIKKKIDST
jgi:DNA-binding response OmpR family regulator